VIISSAYRIGPFEVESALLEHPSVAEAAVVGKPHHERGEIVKAFVVLSARITGSPALALELQNHVKNVTARTNIPEIEFIDELPKTVSGKIRRVELRAGERRGNSLSPPTRRQAAPRCQKCLRQVFNLIDDLGNRLALQDGRSILLQPAKRFSEHVSHISQLVVESRYGPVRSGVS
jgi:hypothetical protein